jgi:hypothetical protein
MTFVERLKTHIGGLIYVESPIYWYDRHSWDKTPGRVCLLLAVGEPQSESDTARCGGEGGLDPEIVYYIVEPIATTMAAGSAPKWRVSCKTTAAALLFIDGIPKWIWISSKVVELIQ